MELRAATSAASPHLTAPVLLRGETGTGKELVARAVHQTSTAPQTEPLFRLESRSGARVARAASGPLLGAAQRLLHRRRQKAPRELYVSSADGGTLFLDEVGEAPLEVQALLLRTLEMYGEIQPVGADAPRRVDVRVVAATDADLEKAGGRRPLPGSAAAPACKATRSACPPCGRRRDDFGRLFLHFVRHELAELGETGRLANPPEGRSWIPAPLVARLAAHVSPVVQRSAAPVRELVIAGHDAGDEGMSLQSERILQEAVRTAAPPDAIQTSAPGVEVAEEPHRRCQHASRSPDDVRRAAVSSWPCGPNRLGAVRRTAAQLRGHFPGSPYDRIEESKRIREAVEIWRRGDRVLPRRAWRRPRRHGRGARSLATGPAAPDGPARPSLEEERDGDRVPRRWVARPLGERLGASGVGEGAVRPGTTAARSRSAIELNPTQIGRQTRRPGALPQARPGPPPASPIHRWSRYATSWSPEEGDTIVMKLMRRQLPWRGDRRGPLPMDAAVRIRREFAEGLGGAHAKGIIHRI